MKKKNAMGTAKKTEWNFSAPIKISGVAFQAKVISKNKKNGTATIMIGNATAEVPLELVGK
jgi:hypothetical protein